VKSIGNNLIKQHLQWSANGYVGRCVGNDDEPIVGESLQQVGGFKLFHAPKAEMDKW
jgi:hypothetical protein